jgi:hypothetical protein
MAEFNPAKAFEQVRAARRREEEVAAEAWRRTRDRWAAIDKGRAALNHLLNLLPGGDSAGVTVDVGKATDLMVEYAQMLPADRVKARVEFVSKRMDALAADGNPVEDAGLKRILLNLLLFAGEGDKATVEGIFYEALRGNANDVEAFRRCLANWLDERVVYRFPPLPEELILPCQSPAEEPDPPRPDGPFDGNAFAWKGEVCRCLSSQQYRLMEYLWNNGRPLQSATYTNLQETVWENREVTWEAVKSAVSRLDGRLNADGIYLGFATNNNHFVLVGWGSQE